MVKTSALASLIALAPSYSALAQPSFGTVVFAEQNPPVAGGTVDDLQTHLYELVGTDVALMLVWKQKDLGSVPIFSRTRARARARTRAPATP